MNFGTGDTEPDKMLKCRTSEKFKRAVGHSHEAAEPLTIHFFIYKLKAETVRKSCSWPIHTNFRNMIVSSIPWIPNVMQLLASET